MEKLSYTFTLMRSSWDVLKKDKELLIFPALSGLCCLLVMAAFALGAYFTDSWHRAPQQPEEKAIAAVAAFAFYFINYFIIIFFNSAIVACAIYRMRGGDPDFFTGFNAAVARLPQILGWALLASTVGMLLRMLQRRSNRAGSILISIAGMAWTLVTFFVVPILVVERKGPIAAVKESAALLKKTWGQQLIGNFSFGLVFMFFGLIGVGLIVFGIMAPSLPLKVILICAGAVYLVGLSLVQSALQTIFQAALYLYALEGKPPAGFDESDLQSAISG